MNKPLGVAIAPSASTQKPTDERCELKSKCAALRSKIHALREKRRRTSEALNEATNQQCKLCVRRNAIEKITCEASANLRSAMMRRTLNDEALDSMRKMNAMNDCFHIWYMGSYGLLNGLRLGNFVPPMLDLERGREMERQGNGMLSGGDRFKVPWTEINAAFGMIALLLVIIQEKSKGKVKFHTHKITPMGSFSKVAVLYNNGKSSTVYNLYSDDGFQLFGKRGFNIALNGLLRCLADATIVAAHHDKTVAPPHSIKEVSRGEYSIGGLLISYGTDGERWTRALKYFLTNLKWLVAYNTKHVDR